MEQVGSVLSVTVLVQQQLIVSQPRLMEVLHLIIFQVLQQPPELGTIMACLQPMVLVKCKSHLHIVGLTSMANWPDLSNSGTINLRVTNIATGTHSPGAAGSQFTLDLVRPSVATASVSSDNSVRHGICNNR